MRPQLDSEFWDFVVDSLEENGAIRRGQASLLWWSTDEEKQEALSEAVSDETWNRVAGDVAEYMLDIVDGAVVPEVFEF